LYASFQVGTVFQESIAAIATIALVLGIGAFFGMHRFGVFEKMITIGLALSLTFNFAIFGPIFIDRSISYHLVMLAADNNKVDQQKIKEVMFEKMFQKRLSELSNANLILLNEDLYITPTSKGVVMTNALIWLGLITSTLGEYKQTNEALNK
jgi:hypothetical protein